MTLKHDWKRFPELTNSEMVIYYYESPHRQLYSGSFRAEVVKVNDGDTIKVRWHGRDFDFPIRFSNIAAPELNEEGGKESRDWLAGQIMGKMVEIEVNWENRVEKWGRLLGNVKHKGLDMGEMSVTFNKSIPWENRNDGVIKNIEQILAVPS